MKRNAPDHPKMLDLQARLGIGKALAVGTVGLLWHWTAKYAMDGAIGRWSNASIAAGCSWEGNPDALVEGLVKSRLVDVVDGDARLVVHDWSEHAEDQVHNALARKVQLFADGTVPQLTKLGDKDRATVRALWAANGYNP